jgi:hypothetical protein
MMDGVIDTLVVDSPYYYSEYSLHAGLLGKFVF